MTLMNNLLAERSTNDYTIRDFVADTEEGKSGSLWR